MDVIPKSVQLVAGRIAQEFNHRKERKGAFLEDRYHATAVEQNEHLISCLVYIDLNMVRAGVVNHSSEWEFCGYNEIQKPPERYGLIDRLGLQNLCGFSDTEQFASQHRQRVSYAIENGSDYRENCWTGSIAIDSLSFVEETKVKLGIKAIGRRVEEQKKDQYVLREEPVAYNGVFDPKKGPLSSDNSYLWDYNSYELDS